MKNALVTTTINVPHNLKAYAEDIKHCVKDTSIIVAGDIKTPPEAEQLCRDIGAIYLGVESQNAFLLSNNWTKYNAFLPWNCIQRRNVAILYAYHFGAEIIATVDDDNLWEDEGYFEQHGELGKDEILKTIKARDTGWLNPARDLISSTAAFNFYPRGYSFEHRGELDLWESKTKKGKRIVNAGLWLGDPDIDAVTRMSAKPDITDWTSNNIVLDIGTKCPFNSQNTALHRDVIPAYCLATGLGRYDDIVASYIVKRIADHLGDYISFGKPIVRQVRNKHDLWKDLEDERVGMQLIDMLVDWLYQIKLSGKTYKECIVELIHDFEEKTNMWAAANPPPDHLAFMQAIVINYKHWMKIT